MRRLRVYAAHLPMMTADCRPEQLRICKMAGYIRNAKRPAQCGALNMIDKQEKKRYTYTIVPKTSGFMNRARPFALACGLGLARRESVNRVRSGMKQP